MKILIVQCMTKEIEEYCLLSLPHNLKYAIKCGYDYKLFQKQTKDFNLHPSWLKIEVFKNLEWNNYDYIWILDADCIINEHTIILEEIINKDVKPIIISANGENGGRMLNAGSFIINSKAIPILLKKYEDYKLTDSKFLQIKYWEQEMINDWYETEPTLFSVRPMDEINSWFLSTLNKTQNMEVLRELINNSTNQTSSQTMEYVYNYINNNINKLQCSVTSELFNLLHHTYIKTPKIFEKTFNEIALNSKKQFVHHLMASSNELRIQRMRNLIN